MTTCVRLSVGTVPVDPGLTNKAVTDENGDRIVGFNTEDKEINEGETRYDLIFYARMPNGLARVIINIEMQRKRPTEYPLANRAFYYYACRVISSQKERDFKASNYGDIKDTYSAWICMNEAENSICDYHLTRDQIMGHTDWQANLDMLHIMFIGVSNDVPEQGASNALHRLLCTLFSETMTSDSVLNILEEEYNIPISDGLGEEVNDMCNLGEGILERGIEQGRLSATTEFVTNMYNNHFLPEQIATGLNLTLDNVTAILTQQGLLQS